jgi:hypothetical protein
MAGWIATEWVARGTTTGKASSVTVKHSGGTAGDSSAMAKPSVGMAPIAIATVKRWAARPECVRARPLAVNSWAARPEFVRMRPSAGCRSDGWVWGDYMSDETSAIESVFEARHGSGLAGWSSERFAWSRRVSGLGRSMNGCRWDFGMPSSC